MTSPPHVIEVGIAGPQYDLAPVIFVVNTGILSSPLSLGDDGVTVTLPIGEGAPNWTSSAANHDPEGWAAAGADYTLDGGDPNNSWQQTWFPGDCIMLPRGVYFARWQLRLTSAPEFSESPTKYVSVWLDQAEWDSVNSPRPYDLDKPPGWYWGDYWNPMLVSETPARNWGTPSPSTYITRTGLFIVDSPDPKPVMMAVYPQGQATIRDIDYYSVIIVRMR